MKERTFILAAAIFIVGNLFFVQAMGQTAPLADSLYGKVLDSVTGNPVQYVTVILKTGANVNKKSIVGKSDGTFAIPNVGHSKYVISVTAIGYRPKEIPVDLSDSSIRSQNVGDILIASAGKMLKEVEIVGNKPLIKQEIDGITYNIEADPDSKAYSLLEMMRKVPLLSLDAEDNILLKGNSNYKILINGKPSSMMERNPKEILRSMPASTIVRIEVITIPPAKYDAEGLAGIINIVTNRKMVNGYSGTVNISERFPAGGPGAGGAFNIKLGKLGISALAGGSIYDVPQTHNSVTRNTSGSEPTTLQQDNLNKTKSRNGYLGLDISYELDSLDLVSTQLNINGSRSEGKLDQMSVLNNPTDLLQKYDLVKNNQDEGTGKDIALNYQRGFKRNKSQLLTFSYKYYTYNSSSNSDIDLSEKIRYPLTDYRQLNVADFSENTFQVDYVQTITKLNLNIEAGLKGIFRDNKSNFQYRSFDDSTGKFELDSSRSNLFNNTQNVLAAYNSLQLNLKDWGFKAGIRLEKTYINGDFISGATTVKQTFLNAIPSIAISRKFKNATGFNVGFTQRIQRPGIYQLNPFVDRSNPEIEYTGNPDLHPIIGNVIQAGYNISRKAFFNFGVDYIFFKTLINQVSVFDSATKITRVTYQNTGHAQMIGVGAGVNYPVTKQWNFSVNAKSAYGKVVATSGANLLSTSGVMFGIGASTSYAWTNGWRISASCSVNGKSISLQNVTKGYTSSSFSVNKSMLKDKLTWAIAVNNPFSKYRYVKTNISGPDFLQVNNNETYFRDFSIRLNYNFGKLKNEAIKKNKRGISNDDIAN